MLDIITDNFFITLALMIWHQNLAYKLVFKWMSDYLKITELEMQNFKILEKPVFYQIMSILG